MKSRVESLSPRIITLSIGSILVAVVWTIVATSCNGDETNPPPNSPTSSVATTTSTNGNKTPNPSDPNPGIADEDFEVIRIETISAGEKHTCAIRTDDKIICWGSNSNSQVDAPTGRFTAISAGGQHTCAIRTDETIECWGNNADRQVDAPTGRFTAISAGGQH
ncbi:MAG: RCC1 domain-containing protein, partial [Acidimicrobiaceae bacterium]|nr:RCC1 domain-containing protein [Acidimicrobiaceae bacterium]